MAADLPFLVQANMCYWTLYHMIGIPIMCTERCGVVNFFLLAFLVCLLDFLFLFLFWGDMGELFLARESTSVFSVCVSQPLPPLFNPIAISGFPWALGIPKSG